MKRPLSISVISYLLIIGSCIGIGFIVFTLFKVSDLNALLAYLGIWGFVSLLFIGPLVVIANIIAAIAMLKGKKWGRTLFLVICVLDTIFVIFAEEWDKDNIRDGIRWLFFLFLLYRPKVTDYFNFMALTHKNEVQKSTDSSSL